VHVVEQDVQSRWVELRKCHHPQQRHPHDLERPQVFEREPISAAAATGAFRQGDAWLAQLSGYLDANFELVKKTIAEQLPDAVFGIPGATYLAWIDLRKYFSADVNLTRFFAERCGVLVEGGEKFVADADGLLRINVACPRSILEDALTKIVAATLA
jgi:cystathionine beta-lyase